MIPSVRPLGCLLLLLLSVVLAEAQTQVQRYDVTKESDYGVVYRLPRTELVVKLRQREFRYTPGTLSVYARPYLNSEYSQQAEHSYELQGASAEVIGVPDSTQQYLVSFEKKSLAPFVKLTSGGVLFSINGGEELCADAAQPQPAQRLLSERKADQTMAAFPREYALATTSSRRAAVAASYLYDLRETMMNLLSGSVENMPKDGESMRLMLDRLRSEERRTLRLFAGDSTERVTEHLLRYTPPSEADSVSEVVVARFSNSEGLLPADDLRGAPIYLLLRPLEQAPVLSEKEQRKKEKTLEGSIVYNLPAQVELQLRYQGRTLLSTRLPLTQYGTQQALSPKMFNLQADKTTAVYLDIHTGAIKQIKNE